MISNRIKNTQLILNLLDGYNQIRMLKIVEEEMVTIWDGFVDVNFRDSHFIRNKPTSSIKTDACNSYSSELLIKLKNIQGLNINNWTKAGLSKYSKDTGSGVVGLSTYTYKNNKELFSRVLSRVWGLDPLLCDEIVNEEADKKFINLVTWFLSNGDLIVEKITEFDKEGNEKIVSHGTFVEAEFKYLIDTLRRTNENFIVGGYAIIDSFLNGSLKEKDIFEKDPTLFLPAFCELIELEFEGKSY